MINRVLDKINNCKQVIAALMISTMILSLGLTGCTNEPQVTEIPELQEPVGTNESFRPVEKMQVGSIRMEYGTVVPEAYPVFSKKDVSIKDIVVRLGDYVEEGDVIAYGMSAEYDDNIEELNYTINSLYAEREMKAGVSDQIAHKLTLCRQACEDVGDSEGAARYTTEINVELENRRYELELIDTKISNAATSKEQLIAKKEKQTFTAPHSGYVTFVADMYKGNVVPHNTNIAVVSDTEDPHIEVMNTNIHDFKYGNYVSQYTYIGDKKVNLEELKYTNAEISCAEANQVYPPVRYKVVSGMKLGDTIPLYFVKNELKDVIAVGNDSLYSDNEEVYVYIKDPATGELAKKTISIGLRDDNFTEVKEGLEEGQEVFYESLTPVPAKYETATVERGLYTLQFTSKGIEKSMTHYDIYTSDYMGEYDAPSYGKGEELSAGDELYSIESATGKAALEEASVALSNLSSAHTETVNSFNERQNALQEELNFAQNEPAPIATDTDAMEQYLYHYERVQCDLNALDLERQFEETSYSNNYELLSKNYNRIYKSTGDNGTITVTVDEDGYAGAFPNVKKQLIYKGAFITTVGHRSDNIIMVVMADSTKDDYKEPARIGQKVQVTSKDGKTYSGTCIGLNGSDEKFYLFTRDGKENITSSIPYNGMNETSFFVKLDDVETASLTNPEITYIGTSMNDVLIIPTKCVYKETNQLGGDPKYFVWKVFGDNLIKQYIYIFETKGAPKDTLVLSGLKEGDVIVYEKTP